jgi:hypothetical protein
MPEGFTPEGIDIRWADDAKTRIDAWDEWASVDTTIAANVRNARRVVEEWLKMASRLGRLSPTQRRGRMDVSILSQMMQKVKFVDRALLANARAAKSAQTLQAARSAVLERRARKRGSYVPEPGSHAPKLGGFGQLAVGAEILGFRQPLTAEQQWRVENELRKWAMYQSTIGRPPTSAYADAMRTQIEERMFPYVAEAAASAEPSLVPAPPKEAAAPAFPSPYPGIPAMPAPPAEAQPPTRIGPMPGTTSAARAAVVRNRRDAERRRSEMQRRYGAGGVISPPRYATAKGLPSGFQPLPRTEAEEIDDEVDAAGPGEMDAYAEPAF